MRCLLISVSAFFFFASTLCLCVYTGLSFIGFHFVMFYFINGSHLMASSATDELPRGSQWGFLDISILVSSGDPCVLDSHRYKQMSYLLIAQNGETLLQKLRDCAASYLVLISSERSFFHFLS